MLGWHVYSGIDLKIPTRLPKSSHLYYISQPIDLLLLKLEGNHLFRLSRKSTDKKNPLLLIQTRVSTRKERNGLKMSASATSVAHPSVPHLSGREWAFFSPSHHICAYNFPNPTPPSPDMMHTAGQTNWFIHFLEKRSRRDIFLAFLLLLPTHHHLSLINSQSMCLVS